MKKTLWKALPYLLCVLLMAGIIAAAQGFTSIFLMRAVDSVTQGSAMGFWEHVTKLIFLLVLLFPANLVLAYAEGFFKKKAIKTMKYEYMKRVFQKNINEFQKDNTAKYLSALTNDLNAIETNYLQGIFEVTVKLAAFLSGVIVIGYVSPLAVLVGLGIGAANLIISTMMSNPVKRHHEQRSQLYTDYTTYIKEVLSAFHIVKTNRLADKVNKDFYRKSERIQDKGYVIDRINTYIWAVQNLTINLSFYLLIAAAVYLALIGRISMGGVILVVTQVDKMIFPLMEMLEWLPKINGTESVFRKLDQTLENQGVYEEPLALDEFQDRIRFEGIAFGYEEDLVFSDVNLDLVKGKKYLVIGPSGGGKSTFLKLLRKYFLPTRGRILVDEKELSLISKESYFSRLSNVEQQVFLFEDTLRNNICLYQPYSDQEIKAAIKGAGLEDFVARQARGLGYIIRDNGKNVSGGEKSRIAIARGLLRKADFLFLDEIFASLDEATAREIEQTLLALEGMTVINVSHVVFPETKRCYDQILVVKHKKITVLEQPVAGAAS